MTHPDLPLIVEPAVLAPHLGHPDLRIVDLSARPVHHGQHVPGAVHLDYRCLLAPRPPALGLMPDDAYLEAMLSSLGVRPDSLVVAYDEEANAKAARFLWTLDVIGHRRFSLLDGGLAAWLTEGQPTESREAVPSPETYRVGERTQAAADKADILARLGDPGTVILDARSPAEFSGLDCRAARGGHIPGAVNFDWTLAIDRQRALRIRSQEELRPLLESIGVTPDKEVIAHCQTHHRSAHTYIVLKALGYPHVRGYAGSWSEWGNDPSLPVET